MKDTFGYSSPQKVTSERDIRVKFTAMVKGKNNFFRWKSVVRGESFVEESFLL
ncbi:hypothetical protein MYX76_17840 [Desulfobacterota bacterium AH_259_B03_O07]|nr:hypothetical protein [Desulfobacterota bacterium AH_259_B03_O07]